MKISIERNLKNIKAKKEIFDDYYLNKIVKLTIKYHHIKGINIFVQSMLYLKNIEEYDTNLYVFNMTYGESIEKIDILYNIFRDWLPFEKYDLGELRGIFLELLTYNRLIEIFKEKNIHRESKLIIGTFKSYTWDYIIFDDEILILSECKFSFESLKRKHVNQMIGTLNKLNPTPYKSYIVLFDTKVKLNAKLEEIQENTSSPNFNNMMKKFNLITIENFDDENPFLELN